MKDTDDDHEKLADWSSKNGLDDEADVLPGTGPGQGQRGRGGLVFGQDQDNLLIVNTWMDDEYGGTWDAGHGCYAFQVQPQPPAGSSLWEGHDPSEGSVWSCDYTVTIPENSWFVPNGEDPLVDPAVLAQEALGRMKLEEANAQIALLELNADGSVPVGREQVRVDLGLEPAHAGYRFQGPKLVAFVRGAALAGCAQR